MSYYIAFTDGGAVWGFKILDSKEPMTFGQSKTAKYLTLGCCFDPQAKKYSKFGPK
jgi:hypothetical protein